MSLSVQVTPGYVFTDGEELTVDKLNLLANPTLDVQGGVDPSTIAAGSVTTAKLAPGAFSADPTGQGKMDDGFVATAKLADGVVSADVLGGNKLPAAAVSQGKLASGVLSADATGRAKVAANFFLPSHFVADAGAVAASGAVTLDWTKGSLFRIAPTGGGLTLTLSQSGAVDGQVIQILVVVPPSYFGNYTVSFSGTTVLWKSGTAPGVLTANAVGVAWLLRLNGNYYGWFRWPF